MRIQRLAIAAAIVHTLVLAAFTFPAEWVPTRLRFWSQAYSRVPFHQDWRLFAPDPPACGCSIEFKREGQAEWQRLEDLHAGPVWQRMAANACRYSEPTLIAVLYGPVTRRELPKPLAVSLSNMIGLKDGEKARMRLDRSEASTSFFPVEFVLERDQTAR